jgi:transcriptional regulator with XRE-family HTH domain
MTVTSVEEPDSLGHAKCVRFTPQPATMCNMQPEELGRRIKAAREQKHWTQQELADKVGASVRSVINWEQGISAPRNRTGALEQVLGISLNPYEEVAEIEVQPGLTVTIPIPAGLSEEARELLAETARKSVEAALAVLDSGQRDTNG